MVLGWGIVKIRVSNPDVLVWKLLVLGKIPGHTTSHIPSQGLLTPRKGALMLRRPL
jgi:hypothetical protein